MNSNFYFYYGIAQEWLLVNGAKRRNSDDDEENEPIKVRYFDDLPSGVW